MGVRSLLVPTWRNLCKTIPLTNHFRVILRKFISRGIPWHTQVQNPNWGCFMALGLPHYAFRSFSACRRWYHCSSFRLSVETLSFSKVTKFDKKSWSFSGPAKNMRGNQWSCKIWDSYSTIKKKIEWISTKSLRGLTTKNVDFGLGWSPTKIPFWPTHESRFLGSNLNYDCLINLKPGTPPN